MIQFINQNSKTFAFFVVLLALGCSKGSNDIKKNEFVTLKENIVNYYNLEIRNDWEQTYLYRTKKFRDTVSKETYKRIMARDAEGWNLLKFKIIEMRKRDSVVEVKVNFIERTPQGIILEVNENTGWTKIDSGWFCQDCGSRTHFSLNAPLVKE